MIKKVHIENFKAFSDIQEIDLKPITLLYGPNSAGKSSIIKSLLLLKQSSESTNNSDSVLLPKGKLTDVGNYQEMVNNHEIDKIITFRQTVDVENYLHLKRILNKHTTKQVSYETDYLYKNNNIKIDSIKIYIDDCIKPNIVLREVEAKKVDKIENRMLLRRANGSFNINKTSLFKVEYIDFPENIIESFKDKFKLNMDIKDIENLIHQELSKHYYHVDKFLIRAFNVDRDEKKSEIRPGNVERLIRFIGELPMAVSWSIEKSLKQVLYLGPLRTFPVRHSIFSGVFPSDVGLHGENTGDLLFLDDKLVDEVNKWMDIFDIKYQIIVRKHSDNNISDLYSIRLYDQYSKVDVSPLDVGFGISQVLPVIVQALTSKNSLICIEQPEIHLHPKHQTQLANLFIDCIDKKNTLLIETHSEHLMLRLQNLIREEKIRYSDVNIVYVDRTEVGSYCLELRLNENGDFIDPWPNGFFEEGYREVIF